MRSFLIIVLLFYFENVLSKTSAIIEDQKTTYHVEGRGSFAISEFSRIKILNGEGYRYAVFQDYYDKFRRISSIKLTIFDAAGKRIKRLTRADALDVMFNGSDELDDSRLLILDPKYRNFPFTIEVEVDVKYESFLDFPLWMPRHGSDLEVKTAQLILEYYPGFEFRSSILNNVAPGVMTDGKDKKVVTWSVTNLPAIAETISNRLFLDEQPQVKITPIDFNLDNHWGSFRSWSEFGDWYLNLNRGRDNLSSETIADLVALKANVSSDRQLVSLIYEYMQKKTRYVSIQLGIGGFQAIPSDIVEKRGYGDCKALTNFMMSLLKQVNIKSHPVLVLAGSDAKDIDIENPSSPFNHVFLAVPMTTDTMWLECTSQQSPASYLGTFTDDRYVLWIQEKGSKIIRTPSYSVNQNKKASRAQVRIDETGNAQVDIQIQQTGAFYDDIRAYQQLTKTRQDAYNYAMFNYKDFTIKSFSFDAPKKTEPTLQLNYMLQINGLAKSVAGKLLIPANVIPSIDREISYDVQNKKTEVRRAFTLEDEIVILVPERYWADVVPKPLINSSRYGNVEITIVPQDGNQIMVKRRIVINKGIYRGSEFDAFYEFVRKIKSYEQSKIVLQSKT